MIIIKKGFICKILQEQESFTKVFTKIPIDNKSVWINFALLHHRAGASFAISVHGSVSSFDFYDPIIIIRETNINIYSNSFGCPSVRLLCVYV